MRNQRRRMTGVVTEAKAMKTVSVRVDRSFRHRLYGKVVHRSRSFLVHDEVGCRLGDQVQIVESRPISKMKRWVVETILRHASEVEVAASGVAPEDLPAVEAQG